MAHKKQYPIRNGNELTWHAGCHRKVKPIKTKGILKLNSFMQQSPG